LSLQLWPWQAQNRCIRLLFNIEFGIAKGKKWFPLFKETKGYSNQNSEFKSDSKSDGLTLPLELYSDDTESVLLLVHFALNSLSLVSKLSGLNFSFWETRIKALCFVLALLWCWYSHNLLLIGFWGTFWKAKVPTQFSFVW
jgi:hypothetical protein